MAHERALAPGERVIGSSRPRSLRPQRLDQRLDVAAVLLQEAPVIAALRLPQTHALGHDVDDARLSLRAVDDPGDVVGRAAGFGDLRGHVDAVGGRLGARDGEADAGALVVAEAYDDRVRQCRAEEL